MKYVLLVVLFAMSSPIIALDSCMSGSWRDVEIKHEGINVEVLAPDRAVAYFYTWEFFDRDTQNWVVFVGDPEEMEAFDIVSWEETRDEYKVGTGSLVAVDANTLKFSHDFVLNLDLVWDEDEDVIIPYCLDGQCEKTYVYTRLTQPIPCG